MQAVEALGEVERARKKGYVSLRHKRQFGMISPGSAWVEVGLILRDASATGRLVAAARADAMFSHRVRIASEAEIDAEFLDWLTEAYHQAG